MSDTWLTPEEVEELTARQRWSAQCRKLAQMGVPFRPNAVGRPLVERTAVCSNTGAKSKPAAKRGPNWEALRGKAA
jgi:hypothetical protein